MPGKKPSEQYCIIEQYEMLMRCSKKKNIAEWNEWREKNANVEIHLVGAEFGGAHLDGTNFRQSHLDGTNFYEAHLGGANFNGAHLDGAEFSRAHLDRANFWHAHLDGANFWDAYLDGARFTNARVNGDTIITSCSIDEKTDFRSVGLDSMRIDAGIKEALKYNRRKMNWKEWIFAKWRCLYRWPVWLFWQISDYGSSTMRVGLVFFALSILFSFIYLCGVECNEPCEACNCEQIGYIKNLVTDFDKINVWDWHLWLRAFYFSIVTMTTLGFGDMCAHECSAAGYIILIAQVLLGYLLLGALITRLGIMFTASGPVARNGTMPDKIRKK